MTDKFPYIKHIEEGTRVLQVCHDCLQGGVKEPMVRFGHDDSQEICRICGKIAEKNNFECCSCHRAASLIVCSQGRLDTIRMTWFCNFCFTNLVEEWK